MPGQFGKEKNFIELWSSEASPSNGLVIMISIDDKVPEWREQLQ